MIHGDVPSISVKLYQPVWVFMENPMENPMEISASSVPRAVLAAAPGRRHLLSPKRHRRSRRHPSLGRYLKSCWGMDGDSSGGTYLYIYIYNMYGIYIYIYI